jgi:hypothetical protein
MLSKIFKGLALLTLPLLTNACQPGLYTGGGFTESPAGDKQTFGFVADAIDSNNDGTADISRGQFQLNDAARSVRLHAELTGGGGSLAAVGVLILSDGSRAALHGFAGTYEPQPKTLGPGGNIEVYFLDVTSGPSAGQRRMNVRVLSGVHAGYRLAPGAGGYQIGKGVIKFHGS